VVGVLEALAERERDTGEKMTTKDLLRALLSWVAMTQAACGSSSQSAQDAGASVDGAAAADGAVHSDGGTDGATPNNDGASQDGSATMVCGIDCSGMVSCTGAEIETGVSHVQGADCIMDFGGNPTYTLHCDGTLDSINSAGGTAHLMWTGSGPNVTITAPNSQQKLQCTVSP
jgi:hypothetical protein